MLLFLIRTNPTTKDLDIKLGLESLHNIQNEALNSVFGGTVTFSQIQFPLLCPLTGKITIGWRSSDFTNLVL